jgi:phosphoglycerate dehydrogenase-like enzyme
VSLRVYIPRPPRDDPLALLRERIDSSVELLLGGDPPGACEVLVEGTPRPTQLACAGLRAVIVPWAGLPDVIHAQLAERPEITVHNLHHNAPATAEMAVALLLAAARAVVPLDQALRQGDWSARRIVEGTLSLTGRTALILGYGHVGRLVARACGALGMRVFAVRRGASGVETDGTAEVHPAASLRALLPGAQALIICLPHTPETDGVLGREELALLPRDCVVVNVGRAAIVDEHALYEALRDGRIHSAGLDVWYRYPGKSTERTSATPASRGPTLPASCPFHELDNVVMSPHRAGLTGGTELDRMAAVAELLNAAARGEPIPNRVDLARRY